MSMALVLSATAPRRADGADEQTTARLEVRALPSCTTREELIARVTARSRRISFTETGANLPEVRATIERGAPPGKVIGEMELVRPDGRHASRRITAPSCAEATDALALVIALTLDPTGVAVAESSAATGAPAPTSAPRATGATTSTSAPHATGSASATAPSSAPSSTAPSSNAPRAAAPAPPTPTEEPRARAADDALAAPPAPAVVRVAEPPPVPIVTRLRYGADVAGQMVSGPAPDAMWGVSIAAGVYWDRNALWSPALILSLMHTWSGNLAEAGSTAAFTLDAVTLDACPTRLQLAIAEARICATASAGRLFAEGSDTFSPASAARLVASAGGAASIGLEFGAFELSGRFGAGASLDRPSYQFVPEVFHRVAAVTLTASFGVGIRFP
jgi:hypothetical protein